MLDVMSAQTSTCDFFSRSFTKINFKLKIPTLAQGVKAKDGVLFWSSLTTWGPRFWHSPARFYGGRRAVGADGQ